MENQERYLLDWCLKRGCIWKRKHTTLRTVIDLGAREGAQSGSTPTGKCHPWLSYVSPISIIDWALCALYKCDCSVSTHISEGPKAKCHYSDKFSRACCLCVAPKDELHLMGLYSPNASLLLGLPAPSKWRPFLPLCPDVPNGLTN